MKTVTKIQLTSTILFGCFSTCFASGNGSGNEPPARNEWAEIAYRYFQANPNMSKEDQLTDLIPALEKRFTPNKYTQTEKRQSIWECIEQGKAKHLLENTKNGSKE